MPSAMINLPLASFPSFIWPVFVSFLHNMSCYAFRNTCQSANFALSCMALVFRAANLDYPELFYVDQHQIQMIVGASEMMAHVGYICSGCVFQEDMSSELDVTPCKVFVDVIRMESELPLNSNEGVEITDIVETLGKMVSRGLPEDYFSLGVER